jgi:hypothetical protein
MAMAGSFLARFYPVRPGPASAVGGPKPLDKEPDMSKLYGEAFVPKT